LVIGFEDNQARSLRWRESRSIAISLSSKRWLTRSRCGQENFVLAGDPQQVISRRKGKRQAVSMLAVLCGLFYK
jgi:hypothetical protein